MAKLKEIINAISGKIEIHWLDYSRNKCLLMGVFKSRKDLISSKIYSLTADDEVFIIDARGDTLVICTKDVD